MSAVAVRGVGVGSARIASGSHTAFLVGANPPGADESPAGTGVLAGVDLSDDELTAAVISAMTLFGRCGIRTVVTWETVTGLSLDRLVA